MEPLSLFETCFLTVSPFSSEVLSLLTTAAKFNLFACSSSLALYRDACYTWQDVCLTKDGYQPYTSLGKINYQVNSRLQGPQSTGSKPLPKRPAESNVDAYFCPTFRNDGVWSLLNARPNVGSVLSSLTLDGTGVTMSLVVDIMRKCLDEGRGLKYLSIRYCDRIRFDEVLALLPPEAVNDVDSSSDSGFESSGEADEDDSIFRTLNELRVYGIRDIQLQSQQMRQWQNKVIRLLKYTTGRMTTDIAWCSPSPNGTDHALRREGCPGAREVPFFRAAPIADTGSLRNLTCAECRKSPSDIGHFCDYCVKDLLCEDCGSFVCNECDPSRDRLVACTDCSIRRCRSCFVARGGDFCDDGGKKHEYPRPSCGAHTRELSCDTCSTAKTVSCRACHPRQICRLCEGDIYHHCGEDRTFLCDCDYRLCARCFTDSKSLFHSRGYKHGSLDELVADLGGDRTEFPPVVPRVLSSSASKQLMQVSAGWSCVWCRILPRRRERMLEKKVLKGRDRR